MVSSNPFPVIIMVLALMCCASGCKEKSSNSNDADSSNDTSGDTDYSGDTNVDTNIDTDSSTPDNRAITKTCASDTDCTDNDAYTSQTCVDSACRFKGARLTITAGDTENVPSAQDVSLTASHLVAARGTEGVRVFPLSEEYGLQPPTNVATIGAAVGIDANTTGFYVAESVAGLETFSFADLPTPIVTIQMGHAALDDFDTLKNVHAGEFRTVLCGYADGASIIEPAIGNPAAVADLDTIGRVVDAYAVNDTQFLLADSLGGLISVELVDGSLEERTILSTEGRVVYIDVFDTTAIVAEYGAGYSILDLSTPSAPLRLSSHVGNAPVIGVHLLGQQTGVIVYKDGLIEVVSFVSTAAPQTLTTLKLDQWIKDTAVDFYENQLAVIDESNAVHLLHINRASSQ